MELIFATIIVLGIGIILMSFNVIFRKKPFPDGEIGHNKELVKRGLVCASKAEKVLWRKHQRRETQDCDSSCTNCN